MRARAIASASSSHWLSAACFQLRPPKRAKLKGRKLELQIIGENYAVDAQTDAHVYIPSTKAIVLPNVEGSQENFVLVGHAQREVKAIPATPFFQENVVACAWGGECATSLFETFSSSSSIA